MNTIFLANDEKVATQSLVDQIEDGYENIFSLNMKMKST